MMYRCENDRCARVLEEHEILELEDLESAPYGESNAFYTSVERLCPRCRSSVTEYDVELVEFDDEEEAA
jgi:hypothetical protein